MGMILRIASSRIVGQGDIVGRSGYFSLNLSANSVMRGRLDARRTLKSLVADLRIDLWAANRLQLSDFGVPSRQIENAGISTYRQHEDFFSARRLGIKSGRILSGIMLNGQEKGERK